MSKGLPVSQDLYLSWGLLSHEAQGCQSIVAVAVWPHQAGGGYGRVMGGGSLEPQRRMMALLEEGTSSGRSHIPEGGPGKLGQSPQPGRGT